MDQPTGDPKTLFDAIVADVEMRKKEEAATRVVVRFPSQEARDEWFGVNVDHTGHAKVFLGSDGRWHHPAVTKA